MAETLKYYINKMRRPKYLEPPRGRRKARIECYASECKSPIIETRWICDPCWRLLPLRYRKALNRAYHKWKSYKAEGMIEACNDTNQRWHRVSARAIKWTYERRNQNE